MECLYTDEECVALVKRFSATNRREIQISDKMVTKWGLKERYENWGDLVARVITRLSPEYGELSHMPLMCFMMKNAYWCLYIKACPYTSWFSDPRVDVMFSKHASYFIFDVLCFHRLTGWRNLWAFPHARAKALLILMMMWYFWHSSSVCVADENYAGWWCYLCPPHFRLDDVRRRSVPPVSRDYMFWWWPWCFKYALL